jgi:hypothetical protein
MVNLFQIILYLKLNLPNQKTVFLSRDGMLFPGTFAYKMKYFLYLTLKVDKSNMAEAVDIDITSAY